MGKRYMGDRLTKLPPPGNRFTFFQPSLPCLLSLGCRARADSRHPGLGTLEPPPSGFSSPPTHLLAPNRRSGSLMRPAPFSSTKPSRGSRALSVVVLAKKGQKGRPGTIPGQGEMIRVSDEMSGCGDAPSSRSEARDAFSCGSSDALVT